MLPKIAPFFLGSDALFPGDFFTLQCSITHGDLPISIYWTFNGIPLNQKTSNIVGSRDNNNDVIISNMGSRSSVLTIDSVKGQHAGKYSCYGKNAAGVSDHSVLLIVNGYCYYCFILFHFDFISIFHLEYCFFPVFMFFYLT